MHILKAHAFFTGNLFPKSAFWVSAAVALHAKPTVAKFSKLFSSNFFPAQNAWQNTIEYRGGSIHATGGNA